MVSPKNQKRTLLNGLNPLSYQGVEPSSPTDYVTDIRDPISGTSRDYQGFDVGDEWENRLTNAVWKLVSKDGGVATWVLMVGSNGNMTNLKDQAGNVVYPDAGGAITIDGGEMINTDAPFPSVIRVNLDRGLDGQVPIAATGLSTEWANITAGANVVVTNSPNGITISAAGGGAGDLTMIADDAKTATSVAGSINVFGTAGHVVTTADMANTFTIDTGADIASSYLTDDANSAVPAVGVLTVAGAHNNNTTSAGSTVTINGDNTITLGDLADVTGSDALTLTTGDATITAGNINMTSTNAAGTIGVVYVNGNRFVSTTNSVSNVFIGKNSGNFTTTGTSNCSIGETAGQSLTTGSSNTTIGTFSGWKITTGDDNTLINAGACLTTGKENVGVGANALSESLISGLTTGNNNTAIGNDSIYKVTTGSRNTGLGSESGGQLTGADSDNICINHVGVSGDVNTLRIGWGTGAGNYQLNKAFIAGIRGITTDINDAIAVKIDSAGQLGTVSSSIRYKDNVKDLGSDSEKIYDLRPVSFSYKQDTTHSKSYGLIAEEVNIAFPYLAIKNKEGQCETVRYDDLPVLLLNELIKLRKRVEELEEKLS